MIKAWFWRLGYGVEFHRITGRPRKQGRYYAKIIQQENPIWPAWNPRYRARIDWEGRTNRYAGR